VEVIRRLYLYAMSGVMLAILAVGLRLLVAVLLDAIWPVGVRIVGPETSRDELSLAAALVGVGLPVWLIHWWLVRRSLRAGGESGEEERGSSTRALYLSVVLAATILFIAGAAAEVVRAALLALVGLAGSAGQPDPPGAIATILVAGGVWAYHAAVRRTDLAGGPLEDGAAWWPRIYLYGAVLVGLFAGIGAFGRLVDALASLLLDPAAAFGDRQDLQLWAISEVALIAVVAAVVAGHGWYVQRLIADPGWRGEHESRSALRVGFFGALLGIAVASVLMELVDAGQAIVSQALGLTPTVAEAGGARPAGLAHAIAVPVLGGLPWLAVALLARRWALDESRRSPVPGRAISVARLDAYLLALIGLAFGGVGLGWLVGLAIDALLGGQRLSLGGGDGWRRELASYLPAAVLGLALWAWRWSGVIRRTSADPVGEAASTARRAALLLVLAVSLIVAVSSLALILYRLFNSLLGLPLGGGIVSELSTPAGALLVSAAVAAYHGTLVRADAQLRARSAARAPAPVGARVPMAPSTPAPSMPAASRSLVLRAASPAELEAVLSAIRSGLPAGARLDDA
jgi:hypothetical protein